MEEAKPETISADPNSTGTTRDKGKEKESPHPSSIITPPATFNVSGGGDADNGGKNHARKKASSPVKSKFDDPKLDPTWLYATLRKEINQEASYHLENDAKLRAVSQGTVNYEQFRQMVLGAHIRPLERNDKVEGCQNGRKPHVVWNTLANSDPKACQKPAVNINELEPEEELKLTVFTPPSQPVQNQ